MVMKFLFSTLLAGACLCGNPSIVRAQQGGGGLGGGGLGGGGLGGGNNNNNSSAGIVIDPQGVVQLRNERQIPAATLKKQVTRFAEERLPANVVVETQERVLSLKHLEAQLRQHLSEKKNLPLEVVFLAGLQRIDEVVFDPQEQDVYLVGPAEAFGPDNFGRMIGENSGRPAMRLEDLIIALRSVRDPDQSIGCSIDPTPDNLAALQQFLRQNSFPATVELVQQRFRAMANVLGNQEISIWGVPEDSHFAGALVEADIRMKRIALGLEAAGVPKIRSHLSLLKLQGNSLQRWWFVPMYEPLETNPERTVFRLKGQRAKLMAQEEISDAGGQRSNATTTRQSTEKFAQLFTQNFQALADHSPPFAELQSLFDFAVVAALINSEGRRHLPADAFAFLKQDESLPLPHYSQPRQLPSSATYRAAGTGTVIGLVGGVTMNVAPVMRAPQVNQSLNVQSFRSVIANQALFGDGQP